MDKQITSTPSNGLANQPRTDLEMSAVLATPQLRINDVPQSPSFQLSEKKEPSGKKTVAACHKKNVPMKSSNIDVAREYLAKTPIDSLELLYNQYVQAAYLAQSRMEDGVSKEQQKMIVQLTALMEKNHDISTELVQTSRSVITLQNKIVLDEQLNLQTDSLKNFDNISVAVSNLKDLCESLDSRRHILKLNNIAPHSGQGLIPGDLIETLKEIDSTIMTLRDKSGVFMQPFTGTTTMTAVLADVADCLEDCNDLSVKMEHLAVEEIGFEIQKLL